MRTISLAGLTLALLAGVTTADAQDREGRWEFSLGALYQLGADLDFEGGSTVATDDDFGFLLTTGYNFTDKLETVHGLPDQVDRCDVLPGDAGPPLRLR